MQVGFYDDFAERLAAKGPEDEGRQRVRARCRHRTVDFAKALARVQEHISDAVAKGRECGLFFEPTVLMGGRWR
ncbi:aldehyde dehydrogenase family protein [Sinorhizobium meliloti]|uniref:aldehyde dehydrogenase family protein n=1 Tax=Rhizobium meliloti TaxID=382 RepID=UPI003DA0BA21